MVKSFSRSSSFAIILMGKRKLVALLSLSSWFLVMVVWLFLAVPWVCQQFVILVFPDHTHYFCSDIKDDRQLEQKLGRHWQVIDFHKLLKSMVATIKKFMKCQMS